MTPQKDLIDADNQWINTWLGKGYVHAWFSWIEWITLTVAILSVCRRLWPDMHRWPDWYAWPVLAVGALSSVLVFLSGIKGFSTYLVDTTGARRWPKWLQWVLVGLLSVTVPVSLAVTLIPIALGIMAGGG
ncbi:MAG: hypothetical protein LCH73_06165 [Proteobacteria bacterium]|nr:hypothetical protein [Pseudomonadota bacterium]